MSNQAEDNQTKELTGMQELQIQVEYIPIVEY
jgi:hypothetical protein